MSTYTSVRSDINALNDGTNFTIRFVSRPGLAVESTVWLSQAELQTLGDQIKAALEELEAAKPDEEL